MTLGNLETSAGNKISIWRALTTAQAIASVTIPKIQGKCYDGNFNGETNPESLICQGSHHWRGLEPGFALTEVLFQMSYSRHYHGNCFYVKRHIYKGREDWSSLRSDAE